MEDTLPTPPLLGTSDAGADTVLHLPTMPPRSEIIDGGCQLGNASTEGAPVGHLLEKSLSWQDWENSFIAFKAFFNDGVKILRWWCQNSSIYRQAASTLL